MEQRKDINPSMNITDLLFLMSEGNPGALRVLMQLMELPHGFMSVLSLDDMNIRGTQIWIGFKDACHENIDEFTAAIKNRDKQMIATINEIGKLGNHIHKAVEIGGSTKRELL